MERLNLILQKLKREWKTFALALSATIVGAWQWAVEAGAGLPDLFQWVPEQYRGLVIFGFGLLMLTLRKYTPTTVVKND